MKPTAGPGGGVGVAPIGQRSTASMAGTDGRVACHRTSLKRHEDKAGSFTFGEKVRPKLSGWAQTAKATADTRLLALTLATQTSASGRLGLGGQGVAVETLAARVPVNPGKLQQLVDQLTLADWLTEAAVTDTHHTADRTRSPPHLPAHLASLAAGRLAGTVTRALKAARRGPLPPGDQWRLHRRGQAPGHLASRLPEAHDSRRLPPGYSAHPVRNPGRTFVLSQVKASSGMRGVGPDQLALAALHSMRN